MRKWGRDDELGIKNEKRKMKNVKGGIRIRLKNLVIF
jgi:hypothetical protein